MGHSGQKLRLTLPDEGDVLHERYRVDERESAGTYGVVYKATDLKTNDIVAVKCLMPSAASSPQVVARFEREIQVIRTLEHPNLISVYDYGFTESGTLYYVMEFLKGDDLGARLDVGPFPARGAVLIGVQVLHALEASHEKGIIHRDLKPENVFLQQDDGRLRIRVLDFGIAKVVGDRAEGLARLTMANEACGTPNYMAPEQVNGDNIGPWTDVYALGLIMLEMVTGEMAVQGDTFIDILKKQLRDEIPIPDGLQGTVLGEVLERSLRKGPQERYQTAAEMRQRLEEALA